MGLVKCRLSALVDGFACDITYRIRVCWFCLDVPLYQSPGEHCGEATTAAGVVATIGIATGNYVPGICGGFGDQFVAENCTSGMCDRWAGCNGIIENRVEGRSKNPKEYLDYVVNSGRCSDRVWNCHDTDRFDFGWFISWRCWWGWITRLFSGNQVSIGLIIRGIVFLILFLAIPIVFCAED